MSAASEALDRVQHALDRAGRHATHLGRLLALPFDTNGRPSAFLIPHVRQLLADSLRAASDGCEVIGCEQNDTRWCRPVALIHVASTQVYTVARPDTCVLIAELMSRMRVVVTVLKDRAGPVSVRLN